mgnify:CR=1 FL=1
MKKFFFFLILLFPISSLAAMSSSNYKIDADVFGAGGDLGTSGSYKLTDTLGESVVGIGSSGNYKDKSGFWYMVNYYLSLAVDSNTVNLGTITPGVPVEGQSVISVSTDSWGGYDLYAYQNHQMTHSDTFTTIANYSCDIGNPCLWSGVGLGFTVKSGTQVESKWGSSPNFKFAYFPLVSTIFHTKSGFSSSTDQTTVGYKLDVPSTQKSGNYSNIISYIVIAKL